MYNFFRAARRTALRAALAPALLLAVAACDDEDPIGPEATPDIVDIATSTADVSTLAAAIQAADLVDALRGAGPFTVFAPVNSAFAALPSGELDRLLQPTNVAELQEILTFHVVAGDIRAADLAEGATVSTLSGESLTFSLASGASVNGAGIIATDIEASNGVIHLIDAVMLPPRPSIAMSAAATPDLSTLVAALEAASLDATLDGAGPFTVFAPVNSAFADLGDGVVGGLLADGDLLTRVLTYHVVAGAGVYSGELTDGQLLTTVEGGELEIAVDGSSVTVNGTPVVAANIRAGNGVIHLVDEVLVPSPLNVAEKAILTPQTTTLAAAVAAGGLTATLAGDGPFTVFAPVNEAFAALGTDKIEVLLDPANQALLQKVLTYHVVSGDIRAADLTDGATVATVEGTEVVVDLSNPANPKINGANIVATDIEVGNGVIHLIDGVLTESLDVVDVAVLNGFNTLVSLVDQQGLTATLRTDNGGEGFTVFAPTESAFGALSSVPSGDALTDVLLYHVVGTTVGSGDLSDGQIVSTLETGGETFTVNISGSDVSLTDASGNSVGVVVTDVPAKNGVIHVIDGVILPN